jgi:hypothetical protein
VILVVYAGMGLLTHRVLASMSRRWRDTGAADLPTPYGPPAEREPARSGTAGAP